MDKLIIEKIDAAVALLNEASDLMGEDHQNVGFILMATHQEGENDTDRTLKVAGGGTPLRMMEAVRETASNSQELKEILAQGLEETINPIAQLFGALVRRSAREEDEPCDCPRCAAKREANKQDVNVN